MPATFLRIVNIAVPPDTMHPEDGCGIGLQLDRLGDGTLGAIAIVDPEVLDWAGSSRCSVA